MEGKEGAMKPYNPADFPFIIGQLKAEMRHPEVLDRLIGMLGPEEATKFVALIYRIMKSFYERKGDEN